MANIKAGIVLDTSQYDAKIKSATDAAVNFGNKSVAANKEATLSLVKLGQAADQVKSSMQTLGGVIAGVGMFEFFRSVLEGASQMVELSNSIGISTEKMMEFQLAGQASGKSAQDIAGMIQKMNLAAQDASDGNLSLRDSFSRLGLSMNDLRSLTPDEAFNKIAHALASMEDPARRAQLATDLMGKSARITDWGDVASNLDKYAGSQKEAAQATEAAKQVMDDMAVKAQEVKNQFLLLAEPLLKWIQPFIEGTDGAKQAAQGLAVVMALFSGAAVLVGVNAVKDAVIGLAGSLGIGSLAAKAESSSLEANSAAITRNAALKTQSLAAKVASYEASVLEARGALAAATTESEAAIATATLEKTVWRLVVAKGALAEATGAATAAQALSTPVTAAGAAVSGTAAVATTGFAAAMGSLRVATVAAIGPIGALIAMLGSVYAVYQATFGEKHGVFSSTGDQSGANFISDFFGITDSTAGEVEASTKAMTAKMLKDQEEMLNKMKANSGNKPSVLNPNEGDLDPTAAAAQGIKNQTAAMLQNNQLAAERLRLEISLVGAADSVREAALAKNSEDIKLKNDILRINGEIRRLEIDAANSRTPNKNDSQIAELTKQKQLISEQVLEMGKLKGELTEAVNLERQRRFFLEDQLKVTKEVSDIRIAMDELTMTNDEKKLSNIEKQVNAELEGIVKIKEAQLGRSLTQEEINPLRSTLSNNWQPVRDATQDLIDKSREFNTGWTKAWKDYNSDANNAALQSKTIFDALSNGFESAVDQMVRTGKVGWKQILTDLFATSAKMDAQKLFAAVSNPGSSSGGFFSGIAKFFAGGFAGGGTIPSGKFGVVGERGPELINGPATITPMQAGAPIYITNNISAMDSNGVASVLSKHAELIYGLGVRGGRSLGAA